MRNDDIKQREKELRREAIAATRPGAVTARDDRQKRKGAATVDHFRALERKAAAKQQTLPSTELTPEDAVQAKIAKASVSSSSPAEHVQALDKKIAAKIQQPVKANDTLQQLEEAVRSKQQASNPSPSIQDLEGLIQNKMQGKPATSLQTMQGVGVPRKIQGNAGTSNPHLEAIETEIKAKMMQGNNNISPPDSQEVNDHAVMTLEDNLTIPHDDGVLLAADLVPENVAEEHRRIAQQAELRVWDQIHANAATAEVVKVDDDENKSAGKKRRGLLLLLAVLLLVAVVVATVLGTWSKKNKGLPTPAVVEFLQDVSLEKTLRYPVPTNPTAAEKSLDWIAQQVNNQASMLEEEEEEKSAWLERFVLATIWFQSTNVDIGPIESILNCTWSRVSCDEEGKAVYADFNKMGLQGTVSADLSFLTKLTDLVLPRNRLTMALPSEIGALTSLQRLLIFQNQLTGPVPTELGLLRNITEISVGSNSFSGPIPTELGLLTKLTQLELGENKLTGTIPTELTQLMEIPSINIQYNQISGTIPTELALMTNLRGFDFASNQLTGSIPPALPPNLDFFVAPFNELTGSIPTEMGELKALETLVLLSNSLVSAIPSELGALEGLATFHFQHNTLLTPIPPEFLGGVQSLQTFVVSDTNLSVPLADILSPSWTETLTRLEVSGNPNLEGTLDDLVSFTSLEKLDASETGLTGTLSSALQFMTDMYHFDISSTYITGTMPPELASWSNVATLVIYNTNLTGVVPWCAEGENLDKVQADCDEVECECCHDCCGDESKNETYFGETLNCYN